MNSATIATLVLIRTHNTFLDVYHATAIFTVCDISDHCNSGWVADVLLEETFQFSCGIWYVRLLTFIENNHSVDIPLRHLEAPAAGMAHESSTIDVSLYRQRCFAVNRPLPID